MTRSIILAAATRRSTRFTEQGPDLQKGSFTHTSHRFYGAHVARHACSREQSGFRTSPEAPPGRRWRALGRWSSGTLPANVWGDCSAVRS